MSDADDSPIVLLRIDRAAARHTRHPRHLFPPLDLKYVQAGLESRHGIPTRLVDGWLTPFCPEEIASRVCKFRPNIVVLRGVSWCLDELLQTALRLKLHGVTTVAIGQAAQHALIHPPSGWGEAIDHTIPGEPEEMLPGFLASLLSQALKLERRQTPLSLVTSPDSLPSPVFTDQELLSYPFPFPLRQCTPQRWGYLITAWGCPRPCRHCTALVRNSVGRPLRPRSIDSVVDEVAKFVDRGVDAIVFQDDSLFVHRTRFLSLADQMIRRGITLPWMANARPDEFDNELVDAARRCGAKMIKVGIDSGSPRMIEAIDKGTRGEAWCDMSRQAFALLYKAGIGSTAMFVVGLPGETSADAECSLRLALELPADYLQVQLYRAYPDVALWEDLPPIQRVSAAEYHYGDISTQCSAMTIAELAAWPRRFYRQFYLRPRFIGSHLNYAWRHYAVLGPSAAVRAFKFLSRNGKSTDQHHLRPD